jgi:hypothetical protein
MRGSGKGLILIVDGPANTLRNRTALVLRQNSIPDERSPYDFELILRARLNTRKVSVFPASRCSNRTDDHFPQLLHIEEHEQHLEAAVFENIPFERREACPLVMTETIERYDRFSHTLSASVGRANAPTGPHSA